MEHIIKVEAGYDCIRFECRSGSKGCKPSSDGSHGRHGVSIRFVSKGEEGAVQFLLYTGWLPQYTTPSHIGCLDVLSWGSIEPMPADLGFHSKTPRYEGQTMAMESCEFCDGQPCYYDGSSLNSHDAMYTLVNGGDEALWTFLDVYYVSVFSDGKYPKPTEYPMPLRKRR